MLAMGHKKCFLRHAVSDDRYIIKYDCEEQTQIKAFIQRSSSPSRAESPATINSTDWRARYAGFTLKRFLSFIRFSKCDHKHEDKTTHQQIFNQVSQLWTQLILHLCCPKAFVLRHDCFYYASVICQLVFLLDIVSFHVIICILGIPPTHQDFEYLRFTIASDVLPSRFSHT